ncbi:MAG TPA: CatB-related O-acetyltransferase [Solirubrobacterales bacterium]|jgi:acetyltransferase-like isoleucine patch superfamily enzyme|nr:CatB-related O-acetyltransferase [Solirubrobacterales bacterium]
MSARLRSRLRALRVPREHRRIGETRPTGSLSAKVAEECGYLTMGEHTYNDPTVKVFPGDSGHIAIGRFGSIGAGVELFVGGNHRADWVTTFALRARFGLPGALADGHPVPGGETTIGHDVYLGDGATVLSGVTIGSGALVGARAVVTRDVRPYAIVAGNPAREIGRRFDDDVVEGLLAIEWWNWPLETVLERVDRLCSEDVRGFVEAYGDRLQ